MRFLLDTHTFLWFTTSPVSLSASALALIQDAGNVIYFSIASAWEMSIKINLGKLQLKEPIQPFIEQQAFHNNFLLLPIELSHLAKVETLPLYHRDPFDRLLIAQSITETLPILSIDAMFDKYPITRLW